jgi:hypothetical protein
VEFVQTAPGTEKVVNSTVTQRPLLPGGSERLNFTVKGIVPDIQHDFLLRIDGKNATKPVAECREDDNTANTSKMCRIIM